MASSLSKSKGTRAKFRTGALRALFLAATLAHHATHLDCQKDTCAAAP